MPNCVYGLLDCDVIINGSPLDLEKLLTGSSILGCSLPVSEAQCASKFQRDNQLRLL